LVDICRSCEENIIAPFSC